MTEFLQFATVAVVSFTAGMTTVVVIQEIEAERRSWRRDDNDEQ